MADEAMREIHTGACYDGGDWEFWLCVTHLYVFVCVLYMFIAEKAIKLAAR